LFLAADFRHTTIADMVDDFATGFRFQIEDSANVVNTIASVYARRDGADNEGKLEFLAGTNGTEVGLTINSDLVIDVAQNFSRLTMVTDTSSVHSIDRENATNSASIKSSLRLKTKSAGASPVDGFGSGMFFMIEDLGGTAEVIGQIGFSKDGALNKGALEIKGGTDGAETFLTIDASGKTTFNESALSGGDFEVKAQTSGTAIYADVSAGFFGVGGVPDRIFSVNAASNITSAPRIVRNTSLTDSVSPALELENFSTGNMVDGFGTEIGFQIRDSGSESNIGRVRFVRDGADNQGKFVVLGGTNASDELFTIDSNNKSVFNVSGALNGDLEVLGSGGSTSVIYAKASNNRTGFGTDTPGGVIHTVGPTPIIIQRENSSNNSPQAGIDLLHKTSLDALDGLGPSVRFGMQDNTSVHVVLGEIAAVRDGADTEGKIIFKTGTNGSEQMASIDASGKTTFNEAALSGGDFEVKAETTGTAIYADVSEKQMVIGSNTSFVNADLMLDNGGYLGLKETTTPTATASYAKVYTKSDNKLYFQDGAGVEHELAFV